MMLGKTEKIAVIALALLCNQIPKYLYASPLVGSCYVVLQEGRDSLTAPSIATWFKNRREELGLSQEELADRSGVKLSVIHEIEKERNYRSREDVMRDSDRALLQNVMGVIKIQSIPNAAKGLKTFGTFTTIHQWIKAEREKRRYNAAELSLKLGLPKNMIWRLEKKMKPEDLEAGMLEKIDEFFASGEQNLEWGVQNADKGRVRAEEAKKIKVETTLADRRLTLNLDHSYAVKGPEIIIQSQMLADLSGYIPLTATIECEGGVIPKQSFKKSTQQLKLALSPAAGKVKKIIVEVGKQHVVYDFVTKRSYVQNIE